MKQRLCLAKTLVHDPKLLLLDEPASGLDPRARIEFRALLKELRQMGKTIFVSSHILPELADFCTAVGIMERGQLVVAGRVHDIVQKLEGSILLDVRLTGDNENGARALEVVRAHPLGEGSQSRGQSSDGEFRRHQRRTAAIIGGFNPASVARGFVRPARGRFGRRVHARDERHGAVMI